MRKITRIKAKECFKMYRLSHGITREEIAKSVNCTSNYIGMIENRDCGCREKTAMKICSFFEKKFNDLFIIE